MRRERAIPGTWQQWCSAGRRPVHKEVCSKPTDGLNEEGQTVFKILFSYVGGILQMDEDTMECVDIPDSPTAEAAQQEFSLPEEHSVGTAQVYTAVKRVALWKQAVQLKPYETLVCSYISGSL